MIASIESHAGQTHDLRVIDIGCGGWTYSRDLWSANNDWVGVDPSESGYGDTPTCRTHAGTVSDLPFEQGTFDVAIANQSMEHWFQFGTSFFVGLREIHRVLKPGGRAILNVPIHFHGHPIFVRGDLIGIRSMFEGTAWRDVHFEEWGRDRAPSRSWPGWLLNRKVHDDERSWLPHPLPENSWMLEIIATKGDVAFDGCDSSKRAVMAIDAHYRRRMAATKLWRRVKRRLGILRQI